MVSATCSGGLDLTLVLVSFSLDISIPTCHKGRLRPFDYFQNGRNQNRESGDY
jgi:hypothetical protein